MGRAARLHSDNGRALGKKCQHLVAPNFLRTTGRSAHPPHALEKNASTIPFRFEVIWFHGRLLSEDLQQPHSAHRDAVGAGHTINHDRQYGFRPPKPRRPGMTAVILFLRLPPAAHLNVPPPPPRPQIKPGATVQPPASSRRCFRSLPGPLRGPRLRHFARGEIGTESHAALAAIVGHLQAHRRGLRKECQISPASMRSSAPRAPRQQKLIAVDRPSVFVPTRPRREPSRICPPAGCGFNSSTLRCRRREAVQPSGFAIPYLFLRSAQFANTSSAIPVPSSHAGRYLARRRAGTQFAFFSSPARRNVCLVLPGASASLSSARASRGSIVLDGERELDGGGGNIRASNRVLIFGHRAQLPKRSPIIG